MNGGGVSGVPGGRVDPGFEPVREAFAAAVPASGAGGAFSAVVDGRTVVDLWSGTADDAGLPWLPGTAALVFSGTKGVVATAVLLLVQRGVLDLDLPVARLWPEFAVAGKQDVTVAEVMAHTAGLPGVGVPVSVEQLCDPVAAAGLLAGQVPLVEVGRPTYHALTYGWLVDAMVRRTTGRPVAELVRDEIAGPLGLDLWIGVPPDRLDRVAATRRAPGYEFSALDGNQAPDPRLALVYGNPPLLELDWTSPTLLGSQIPAANGVATARSMARLYGCLALGGAIDGYRLLDPATVLLGRTELSRGDDPLSGRPLRFGVGFELAGTPSRLGPAADAFGHTGAGGSSHGAWPGLRTGFSFVTAELRAETADDRAETLLATLHDAVVATATG